MPTTVEIVSGYAVLVRAAGSVLRKIQGADGSVQVTERHEAVSEVALRHARDYPADELAKICRGLRWIDPQIIEDVSLPPGQICLLLGTTESAPFENVSLRLHVNEPMLESRLEEDFSELTGAAFVHRVRPVRRSKVAYGGAGRFLRKATALLLLARGVEVKPSREWDPSDMDLHVDVCSPEIAARPAIEHNPIRVFTDDLVAAEPILEPLRRRGFLLDIQAMEKMEPGDPEDARFGSEFRRSGGGGGLDLTLEKVGRSASPGQGHRGRFGVGLEVLGKDYQEQKNQLLGFLEKSLAAAGVSGTEMPLEPFDGGAQEPCIVLPVGALRAGALLPYGPHHARRFSVLLAGDDLASLHSLKTRLLEAGFGEVRVAFGSQFRRLQLPGLPPRITWPAVAPSEELKGQVRGLVAGMLAGVSEETPVEEREEHPVPDTIRIDLPLGKLRSEGLESVFRQHAASLDVQIFTKNHRAARLVADELRRRGFGKIQISSRSHMRRVGIFHGHASTLQMERLSSWLGEQFSQECPAQKIWGGQDNDVHIWLPDPGEEEHTEGAEEAEVTREPAPQVIDLQAWVHGAVGGQEDTFFSRKNAGLRVGDVHLPSPLRGPHPRTPRPEDFGHYVLDVTTASTIRWLASAVKMREPCLLEGETCTSKTSAILYLAALLGQPAVRLNLSGQTDTSELVGRHVPASGSAAPWRWQDGLVVEAMTQGYWLILDEMNLAEPQVLERLNSVLEREPSLVLSEHDGRVLSHGQVHRDFRIFATMNPATYAGRSPISPAFRDRFRAYRSVPLPDEQDILAFLRSSVLGEGGSVQVAGRRYRTPWQAPICASLGVCPLVDRVLPALARFHASVTNAFRVSSGPSPRERYAFSRRALLSLLDFLASEEVTEARLREALVRYYVDRVLPADQPTMIRLLDASGLGPGTWSVSAAYAPRSEERRGELVDLPSGDLGLELLALEAAL